MAHPGVPTNMFNFCSCSSVLNLLVQMQRSEVRIPPKQAKIKYQCIEYLSLFSFICIFSCQWKTTLSAPSHCLHQLALPGTF